MDSNSILSLQIIYEGLWADPVAKFFILVILSWFSLALLSLLSKSSKLSNFIAITPTSLTTLGIIGTFLGILLGLAQFDVNQLEQSVPALLDGMKLAFTTSITGIASSLAYKFVLAFADRAGKNIEQVTPSDILSELKKISEKTSAASADNKSAMEDLRTAISSEKDSSLVTQVQKLRSTVSDGQNDLIKEFQEFATNMADNNQKALIEALEDVIRDFNEKLTEQFGENFKQLNQAVEKLVTWQEEYRKQLEVYQERLNAAVEALDNTETALSSIEKATSKIPEAIERLDPTTKMLIQQLEILEKSLESIHSLREKTDQAFPTIEQNLERITSGFSDNVTVFLDTSKAEFDKSKKSLSALNTGYDEILGSAKLAQEKFGETIDSTVSKMSESAESQFVKHGQLIENSAVQSDKAIQDAWAESTKKIASQFETFDENMGEQLGLAMQRIGKALASISEKFASDYTPLAEELQRVLKILNRDN